MKPVWKKIEDAKVRHIWKCKSDGDGCDKSVDNESVVDPTFYEDNGTPVCMCGDDMRYIRTEILVSPAKKSKK